jgi:hypothetical protein
MTHALATSAWCLACIVLDLPLPCLFWAPAWYCGREVAQAEHRYIEAHGGRRAGCPWWCGFCPSAWTAKGLLDWLLPLATSLAALIGQAVLW